MPDDILDLEELQEEFEDDNELLARMLAVFDRDCAERLPKLRKAIAAGDCATIMSEAHALKGSVGNFFAKAAYDNAAKLEMMGRNQEAGAAEATLQILEADLRRLRQVLDEIVEQ